jgi:hypothetical protein
VKRRSVLPGLLCSALLAQEAPPVPQPSLHDAWLREILDLDVASAAAAYERVAATPGPGNLERWVAAARLGELHRLQAAKGTPVASSEPPAPLRATFQALQAPLPTDELLERVRREPSAVLQLLATESGRLPPLRPAVPAAEEWVMGQIGPSLRDRMRQRMESLANRSRSTDVRRFTERLYSLDIVRAELQGRSAQANALRALYFADWRPPETPGEPTDHLLRVRTNLDAWLAETELGAQQQTVLRELKDGLDKQAATDPAAALALVKRMPLYAERLLDASTTTRR